MKISVFNLFLLGLIFSFNSAVAAGTNLPLRLNIELRDGSHLVGESLNKKLKFHSALFGDFGFQVDNIHSLDCSSSNSVTLSTVHGDALVVSFLDTELAVKTSFGKIEIPVNTIRKLTTAGMASSTHPPGLVGQWLGQDEGRDSAGENNGTLNDVASVDSPMGAAFHLDGANSYIEIPDSPALRPQSITVAAWLKFNMDESPGANIPGQQEIVFKLNSHDPHKGNFTGYCLLKNGNTFALCVGTPRGQTFANSMAVPKTGIWYHVVGTYDGDTGEAKIYVNGIQQGVADAGAPLDCGTTPVFIGTTHEWFDAKLQGDINRIEIYNRALSAGEIKSLCMQENNGELPLATMRTTVVQPLYSGSFDYPDPKPSNTP